MEIIVSNALISAACFAALWLIALRVRDVSFIDSWWGFGIAMLALLAHFRAGDATPPGILLCALATIWGTRLGAYLLWRWRAQGPDRRYQRILGRARLERRWGFPRSSFFLIFAPQAALQFVVSLPVQLGQLANTAAFPGPLGLAGVTLASFGILFESVADLQLVAFRSNKANAEKVLDRGLWRYTRHPNYFGDACVWWGLYLLAAETPYGAWSLPGPLLITLLLTRWSGVPLVEEPMRRKRPDYADYVARTSSFIPWPPKRPAPKRVASEAT